MQVQCFLLYKIYQAKHQESNKQVWEQHDIQPANFCSSKFTCYRVHSPSPTQRPCCLNVTPKSCQIARIYHIIGCEKDFYITHQMEEYGATTNHGYQCSCKEMLLVNHWSSTVEFQTQNSFEKTSVQALMQDMKTWTRRSKKSLTCEFWIKKKKRVKYSW